MIELQSDQANIVGKLFSVGKLLNFLYKLFAQFLAPEIDPFTDAFQQTSLIKKLRIVAANFKEPVGEEQDGIALTQFAREALILRVGKDSENRIKF